MTGLKLEGTGYAVPKLCFSNNDFSGHLDTGDEWIRTRTGIRTRYFCRDPYGEDKETENTLTLALQAGRSALQDSGISPEDIKLVVCATCTPPGEMPSVACMVQKGLRIPEGIPAFDMNAACSGFAYAISAAFSLISAMGKDTGPFLVIGADAMSEILDFSDRSGCVLFGDGAGAAVLSPAGQKDYPFFFHLGARGDQEKLAAYRADGENHFQMDGKGVFRFAVSKIVGEMDHLKKTRGIDPGEIDHILCHQANARILDFVKRSRHLRDEQVFMDLDRFGNTGAASIPIALADMKEKGLLKKGESLLMIGFGGGLTWGSAYMKL